jgi:restriction system protein
MSVPDFQSITMPLLRAANDGEEHKLSQVIERLSQELHLSQEDREQLLPSERQTTFANRVGWAESYLGSVFASKKLYISSE